MQIRKDLKIKAIQAAKEKAIYLAKAIGEDVGVAVTITEGRESGGFYMDVKMKSRIVCIGQLLCQM